MECLSKLKDREYNYEFAILKILNSTTSFCEISCQLTEIFKFEIWKSDHVLFGLVQCLFWPHKTLLDFQISISSADGENFQINFIMFGMASVVLSIFQLDEYFQVIIKKNKKNCFMIKKSILQN